MDVKIYDYTSEYSLLLVTALYSSSLTLSSSFYNAMVSRDVCNPFIPFGECPIGEYEGRFYAEWNSITFFKCISSSIVVFLAGFWSDSHGRRRKPLIFIPIVGAVLTDGLFYLKQFWYWPDLLRLFFPDFYVGRNMFWIGIMSYVSENSTVESRTLKLGIMIATYTISTLIGSGVVAIFHLWTYYSKNLFAIPILFNLIAIVCCYFFVKDTSDTYNNNVVWLRPKSLFNGFTTLFKNKLKSLAITLILLIICESILVARMGSEYVLIMNYINNLLRPYGETIIYFSIIRMLTIFFGTVLTVTILSYRMKINDLVIGIFTCCLYIFAAGLYIIPYSYLWQLLMILIIYLCHGTIVTITASLLSKMVKPEELGRLNCIQTVMNTFLTFIVVAVCRSIFKEYNSQYINFCIMIVLYGIMTLPILFVLVFLYYKCKFFWEDDTNTKKTESIFVISS